MKNELNNPRRICWTPERRAAQAVRIRQQKPWMHSTGPRTPQGKEKSKANALKHGWNTATVAALREALRRQRHYVRDVLKRRREARKINSRHGERSEAIHLSAAEKWIAASASRPLRHDGN